MSSSSSSSSQRQMGPGLTRFVSAPGSLLESLVDSAIAGDGAPVAEFSAVGPESMMSRFFSSGHSSCLTAASETACMAPAAGNTEADAGDGYSSAAQGKTGLQRSYGFVDPSAPAARCGPPLTRHSSSPAEFLSQLMVDSNGFSVTRDAGNFSSHAGYHEGQRIMNNRLPSQLNFSRQDSLSWISEGSIPDQVGESVIACNGSKEPAGNIEQSYVSGNLPMLSWDDTNSIVFTPTATKRSKDSNGNIVTGMGSLETQFSLPQTSVEMAAVERFLQMQTDSVPCKIRAKRGCATHPRSIAERDRRTRISEKLKKLEELIPNMDKQTNTADMLDMAVQHIKDLQSQIQLLKQEGANCSCGGSQTV